MRKFLVMPLLLSLGIPALADDAAIRGTIEHLQAICAAHPEFHASSIDSYDPKAAAPFEIEFYEDAQSLHRQPRAVDILLGLRKTGTNAEVACIDSILNTWPG